MKRWILGAALVPFFALSACFVQAPASYNADIEVVQTWASATFYDNGDMIDSQATVINNGPDAATVQIRTTMHNTQTGADESFFPPVIETVDLEAGESIELDSSVAAPQVGVTSCFWRVTTLSPGDPVAQNNFDESESFVIGSAN